MGCKGDLKVTRVTERFTNFDSDIVEVQWNRLDSRWRQRYTPRVQTQDSDIVLGKDGTGTQLFTVGFPGDKQKSMYAVGYAKELQGDFLNYNVASINGNSGGAVWTTEDYMLVSQTNHGPHQLGQPGWNNNDPEDKEAWNGGPRVNRLYDASATLREIFPSGTNPDISREGYLVWDETLPPLDP
jgi:V8-like Glu-specific endopeptidase